MALLYQRGEKRATTKSVPFLYKWKHVPTGKWYVGSRTALGCNPDDEYICSSKAVKEMITANPTDWHRELLFIGSVEQVLNAECEYLTTLNAKNDPMSFNRHNGDGKFTSTGKVAALSTRLKMSKSRKGLAKNDAHKEAIARANSIGLWIFNNTLKFESSTKAAKAVGVSDWSIRNWAHNNKNGWSFQPNGTN